MHITPPTRPHRLLSHGANPLVVEEESGRTVLHIAALRGHHAALVTLLEFPAQQAEGYARISDVPFPSPSAAAAADSTPFIDVLDVHGFSCLHYTILFNQFRCMEELVDQGASLRVTTQGDASSLNEPGVTCSIGANALHLGAYSGSLQLVEFLVEIEESLHLSLRREKDAEGNAPREVALNRGNQVLAGYLDPDLAVLEVATTWRRRALDQQRRSVGERAEVLRHCTLLLKNLQTIFAQEAAATLASMQLGPADILGSMDIDQDGSDSTSRPPSGAGTPKSPGHQSPVSRSLAHRMRSWINLRRSNTGSPRSSHTGGGAFGEDAADSPHKAGSSRDGGDERTPGTLSPGAVRPDLTSRPTSHSHLHLGFAMPEVPSGPPSESNGLGFGGEDSHAASPRSPNIAAAADTAAAAAAKTPQQLAAEELGITEDALPLLEIPGQGENPPGSHQASVRERIDAVILQRMRHSNSLEGGSRGSRRTSGESAGRPHRMTHGGESALGTEMVTCGVCLERKPNCAIESCSHRLCLKCSFALCSSSAQLPVCPFCRAKITGFSKVSS